MDDSNTEARLDVSAFVGSVLGGSYQVTRLIAEGGMGAVYEAMHLRLGKPVAIKILAHQISSNQEALARFRREAEVTSRLGHPHLVQVIDFGTSQSGAPFLVMERLNGEDLDRRLRRVGKMPLRAAVELTKQTASALAAAHVEGVVHRDLKPANIFLVAVPGEDDFVKILDFGVSKIKAARTKLTRASAVIGTPDYMSPEQATGLIDEIDHRTDQWALGCIAWEMLAGRAPFIADDVTALFYQIVHMDPHPIGKWVTDLPSGVEPVLRRALSKQSDNRFPSIKEFSRALEAAAGMHVPTEVGSDTSGATPSQKFGTITMDAWPGPAPDTLVMPEVRSPTALEEAGDSKKPAERPVGEAPVRQNGFPLRFVVGAAVGVAVLGLALLVSTRRTAAPSSAGPAQSPPTTARQPVLAAPDVLPIPTPALTGEVPPPTDPAPQPVASPAATIDALPSLQAPEQARVAAAEKAKTPRAVKPKMRAPSPSESLNVPKTQPKRSIIEEL